MAEALGAHPGGRVHSIDQQLAKICQRNELDGIIPIGVGAEDQADMRLPSVQKGPPSTE
jgi:hypothetical protein